MCTTGTLFCLKLFAATSCLLFYLINTAYFADRSYATQSDVGASKVLIYLSVKIRTQVFIGRSRHKIFYQHSRIFCHLIVLIHCQKHRKTKQPPRAAILYTLFFFYFSLQIYFLYYFVFMVVINA